MKLGTVAAGDSLAPKLNMVPESADKMERDRTKAKDSLAPSSEDLAAKKLHAEEVLDKIKGLTEDGLYSVRFEMNDKLQKMIVRVVNPENNEVIRQLPPEEILGMMEFMKEFRGQLVDSAT
jgi:flagellar protein FlaG